MKIWVDDIRIPEENGYLLARSVNEAKQYIEDQELMYRTSGGKSIYKIDLIDIDHDAGDYAKYGGDFIKLLDWLEENSSELSNSYSFNESCRNSKYEKNY